jgi:hypothetical protein
LGVVENQTLRVEILGAGEFFSRIHHAGLKIKRLFLHGKAIVNMNE